MENDNLNQIEILEQEKSIAEKPVSNFNSILTNEQKLQYLSNLIQDVDRDLEFSDI